MTEPAAAGAPQDQRHSEETRTARMYRHWRGKLNDLKSAERGLDQNPERTREEEAKLNQVRGAIQVLEPILSDLQQVRPVNQSVLNR